VAVGLVAALLLDREAGGDIMLGGERVLLPAIAMLMVAIGLVAAVGPARRGFRIEPTEALKAE
jgi:hypothetical protein